MMHLDLCRESRQEQSRRVGTFRPIPVLRSVGPLDVDRLVEMEEQLTGRRRRQWYEQKTRHVAGEVYVSIGAEVDGRLVGAMLGTLRNGEFGLPEPIAVLDTILVDRAYQGMGIATAMLKQLAQNLRSCSIQRLRTEISWDERSWNGFLTSHGFLPVHRALLDLDMRETSLGSEARVSAF